MTDQLETIDDPEDPWRQWLAWASAVLLKKRLEFVELVPDAASMADAGARPFLTRPRDHD